MNCELKKAWLVSGYNEPREVYAIFDENGVPFKMARDEDRPYLNIPSDGNIFQTYEEAASFHNSILPTFSKEQVKSYLEWCYDNDKRELLEEIIPDNMYNFLYAQDSYDNDDDIISINDLREILARTLRGVINLGPTSFHKDQVSLVRYGNECIELVLQDGTRVKTKTETDKIIVESLFCKNRSGLVFPDVKHERT